MMAVYEHYHQHKQLLHAHMKLLHSITSLWRSLYLNLQKNSSRFCFSGPPVPQILFKILYYLNI